MSEQRIAKRIIVNAPVSFANIAQSDPVLHPSLAAVYSRVEASREHMGRQFSGTIRDISTNGAFVVGPPLPLLSRISLSFALDGVGQLEGVEPEAERLADEPAIQPDLRVGSGDGRAGDRHFARLLVVLAPGGQRPRRGGPGFARPGFR